MRLKKTKALPYVWSAFFVEKKEPSSTKESPLKIHFISGGILRPLINRV